MIKKPKVVFIAFLMLSISSCSSDKHIEFHENGNVKTLGQFDNDQRTGTWYYFKNTSDTLKVIEYARGNIIVENKYFSNRIHLVSRYDKGLKIHETTYYPNGKKECEFPIKDDLQDGLCKCYFENGQVKSIFNMIVGKPHNEYNEYFENGQIKLEADNYGNGVHIYYDSLGNSRMYYFKDFEEMDSVTYYSIQ